MTLGSRPASSIVILGCVRRPASITRLVVMDFWARGFVAPRSIGIEHFQQLSTVTSEAILSLNIAGFRRGVSHFSGTLAA
jgi:hypothetical protein